MENKPKVSMNPLLILEDSFGNSNHLGPVKTGSKKEMKESIKISLMTWMQNAHFDGMKNKLIDLAIVLYCSPHRYSNQDVDNVSKIILDSICKNKKSKIGLFENDSQIIRLLTYKLKKKQVNEADTDEFVISFREHSTTKQMILETKDIL